MHQTTSLTNKQQDAENVAIRLVLGGLLAFAAVNAFGGGVYGMAGAGGIPMSWLRGTPFTSYFVPSLVLFFIVGGTFGAAAIAIFARNRRGRAAAVAAGCLALGWITIQVVLIGYVSWLQPAVALAGLVILGLAACLREPTTHLLAHAESKTKDVKVTRERK